MHSDGPQILLVTKFLLQMFREEMTDPLAVLVYTFYMDVKIHVELVCVEHCFYLISLSLLLTMNIVVGTGFFADTL
jgi:hypothetical protein